MYVCMYVSIQAFPSFLRNPDNHTRINAHIHADREKKLCLLHSICEIVHVHIHVCTRIPARTLLLFTQSQFVFFGFWKFC